MRSWIMQSFVIVGLLLMTCGLAIPKSDEKKSRVIEPQSLSDEEHYDEKQEHNVDYDHEAFLGEEDSRTFDQLKPEESRERLGKIVDKIDKNKDSFVTESELQEWIRYTQKRYIRDDVDRQWKAHNPEGKESISWEDYKKMTYGGFVDEMEDSDQKDDALTYKEMLRRDKRRWEAADKNADGSLVKEEFTDFLHPEEAHHMKDIVVKETMEDIDKDKDGHLSLEEYIGDMYGGEGDQDKDEEPDWVKNEREQFTNYRDKNKDGKMDMDEVREWILPTDYDHSEAETRHLIHEADANKDQKLTKQEILDKYDVFVGSQATDFGEALTRHDEF